MTIFLAIILGLIVARFIVYVFTADTNTWWSTLFNTFNLFKWLQHMELRLTRTGFYMYKKASGCRYGRGDVIVKLYVDLGVRRVIPWICGTHPWKIRAESAKVVDMWYQYDPKGLKPKVAYAIWDSCFEYYLDATVYPATYDSDPFKRCSGGIHGFLNLEDTERF